MKVSVSGVYTLGKSPFFHTPFGDSFKLGGVFKYLLLFSPLFGEDSHFDSKGLLQPPSSFNILPTHRRTSKLAGFCYRIFPHGHGVTYCGCFLLPNFRPTSLIDKGKTFEKPIHDCWICL